MLINKGGCAMTDYIKKIYDMMYSPIITPYNLLENSKLDNYVYVKYYKNNDGLITEMQCDMKEEGIKTFYYHFDSQDYLQQIYVISNEQNKELIFERGRAIAEAKSDYYSSLPEKTIAV